MPKALDLTGQRFGRLVVLARLASKRKPGGGMRSILRCACDCGKIKAIPQSSVAAGHARSCGCIRDEKNKERGLLNRKYKTPEEALTAARTRKALARNSNLTAYNAKQRAWALAHPEKINAARRKYRVTNRLQLLLKRQIENLFLIDELADRYLKTVLTCHSTLRASDIPDSLIAVKRDHLKFHRQVREYGNARQGTK